MLSKKHSSGNASKKEKKNITKFYYYPNMRNHREEIDRTSATAHNHDILILVGAYD